MGVLDKFLDAIKLNDDYDDDELLDDSLLEDDDAFFPGCKYGSLCDQAYNHGGSKRNCGYTGR